MSMMLRSFVASLVLVGFIENEKRREDVDLSGEE